MISWSGIIIKDDNYTVKSGYWLASQVSRKDQITDASALRSINPLKVSVWNIQSPHKIRVFLWKVLSGAIPVVDCGQQH